MEKKIDYTSYKEIVQVWVGGVEFKAELLQLLLLEYFVHECLKYSIGWLKKKIMVYQLRA